MNVKAGPIIGFSSRLPYDTQTYKDKVFESVSPSKYRLDTDEIYNKSGCLLDFGPSAQTNGVSSPVGNVVAPSQKLVDVESLLSNRNVKNSRDRMGKVNLINLDKIKKINAPVCNNYLYPQQSRLDVPAINYRSAPINRFYNLPLDPQQPIFYDFAVNTRLEAKDNFLPEKPDTIEDGKFPIPVHYRRN